MSALLAKGADKDALDEDGDTPLIKAAADGNLAAVNCLLAAGADVNVRDKKNGWTALELAAEKGRQEIIDAILQHGVDVRAASEELGCSALHIAAVNDEAGAIDSLIEAGADADVNNSVGCTPLQSATILSNHQAMRALLQRGADANVYDIHGNTLLHLACIEHFTGLDVAVDLLLRSGVDETSLNHDGRTPLGVLEYFMGRENFHPWGAPGGGTCSPEVTERARLLLSRAPADRTWRRRGWLVMLCSRASKAKAAGCDIGGGSRHGANAAGGGGESGLSDVERSDSGVGPGIDTLSHAVDRCVVVGASEDLRAVVEPLIGLGLECVVRTVVGCL